LECREKIIFDFSSFVFTNTFFEFKTVPSGVIAFLRQVQLDLECGAIQTYNSGAAKLFPKLINNRANLTEPWLRLDPSALGGIIHPY
jgi:hypothetical protein